MGIKFMHRTLFICSILVTRHVTGFNVDVTSADLYYGPQQNQRFGYSVSLHSYGSKRWVLVGAPLSNVSSSVNSTTLENYGTVYKCEYGSRSKSCTEIEVDREPMPTRQITAENQNITIDTEKKSGQLLGATLYSSGQTGSVVACAPRFIYAPYTSQDKSVKYQYHSLLGRCFLIRKDLSGTQGKPLNPCKEYGGLGTNYGYCQAGFSAHFTADGADLIMGTVGRNLWKGGVVTYSTSDEKFSWSPLGTLHKGDYLGYSVASGNFTGHISPEFVGGAPRAREVQGEVVIYTQINTSIQVTSVLSPPKGIPIGTYFGSSLCAVDLNNDGYSDLLVGAPRAMLKDEGRVFVYINNKMSALNLQDSQGLMGDNQPNAQFGRAIARVGDLNKDGFQDVAIGAPYEGEGGSGAVYIYHGSVTGLNPTYSQKIKGSSIHPSLRMFGSAIAGGLDMDGNEYEDIAVGSYGSNSVTLLRTRQIVNVKASIKLGHNKVFLENNEHMCSLDAKLNLKCLNVTVCFQTDNMELKSQAGLQFSYTLELDKNKAIKGLDSFRRIFFVDEVTREKRFVVMDVFNLTQQRQAQCAPWRIVYVKDRHQLSDVSSALTFDLNYSLLESCGNNLCPSLNDSVKTIHKAQAFFMKKCKNQMVCVPDLAVNGTVILTGLDNNRTVSRRLRIGLVKELILQLTVSNLVDDYAYYPKVSVTYPSMLTFQRTSEQCEDVLEKRNQSERNLSCDVDKLVLQGRSKKTFEIKFLALSVDEDFSITVTAESQDTDANHKDNSQEFFVAVKYEADLEVRGYTKPDQVIYSGPVKSRETVHEFQENIGPEIIQTIKVSNYGPSVVDGSQVTIRVPTVMDSDKPDSYLIYLLQVEVLGPGTCIVEVNPFNIKSKTANDSLYTMNSRRERRDVMKLDCDHAECMSFRCSLGRLNLGDKVEIKLVTRLWQNTLLRLGEPVDVELETIVRVQPPAKVMQPNEENDIATILVTAKPFKGRGKNKQVPWWVYLVSLLGGIILLAVAVLLLYKAGFFKRRNDGFDVAAEEMTPMNNGTSKA